MYRDEYVRSLKRLTHHEDSDAFLRIMAYAQAVVAGIVFADLAAARRMLASLHAFEDPAEDVKLLFP